MTLFYLCASTCLYSTVIQRQFLVEAVFNIILEHIKISSQNPGRKNVGEYFLLCHILTWGERSWLGRTWPAHPVTPSGGRFTARARTHVLPVQWPFLLLTFHLRLRFVLQILPFVQSCMKGFCISLYYEEPTLIPNSNPFTFVQFLQRLHQLISSLTTTKFFLPFSESTSLRVDLWFWRPAGSDFHSAVSVVVDLRLTLPLSILIDGTTKIYACCLLPSEEFQQLHYLLKMSA